MKPDVAGRLAPIARLVQVDCRVRRIPSPAEKLAMPRGGDGGRACYGRLLVGRQRRGVFIRRRPLSTARPPGSTLVPRRWASPPTLTWVATGRCGKCRGQRLRGANDGSFADRAPPSQAVTNRHRLATARSAGLPPPSVRCSAPSGPVTATPTPPRPTPWKDTRRSPDRARSGGRGAQ